MSYDESNVFAKILRGEMPCAKITEDDGTFSFMDAFPQTRGHCLVIPKAKARDLLDCPPDVAQTLIVSTQRLARAVDKALKPDGLRIFQVNRSPAGQSVFHVHFHVMPVYEGTPMLGHAAAANMADMDELKTLAEAIRAAL